LRRHGVHPTIAGLRVEAERPSIQARVIDRRERMKSCPIHLEFTDAMAFATARFLSP